MEDLVKELTIDMVPDGDNRIIAETIGVENYYKLCSVVGGSTIYCKQKGVPFYKMELPSIIVSYANEGARTKIDELKKVKFSKRSNKAAQGDKSLTVDVDMMIVGGVYQDGVAPV